MDPRRRYKSVTDWLSVLQLIFIVQLLLQSAFAIQTSSPNGYQYPLFRVSQCFKSRSIPKVVFGCPTSGHVIRIVRAFHGSRPVASPDRQCPGRPSDGAAGNDASAASSLDPACSYCDGDCVDDSINEVYDWSSCIGGASCSRTVLQSYIHSCPGRDKFSEYLQVEYQCIPRDAFLNICADMRRVMSTGGELTSPNYPANYPTNQDCSCTFRTDDPTVRMVLSFYDLFLETKNGRCRADWLMLLQDSEKHRHCGVITSGTKNITTSGGQVTLQFHTNADDRAIAPPLTLTPTETDQSTAAAVYKGFWVHFEAEDKRTAINVVCQPLQADDPAAVEARLDAGEDDPTAVRGGGGMFRGSGQNNDVMSPSEAGTLTPFDASDFGRTSSKRLDGDVTSPEFLDGHGAGGGMRTTLASGGERDLRQMNSEGDSPSSSSSGRSPSRANDATEEKRLLPASSSTSTTTHRLMTSFVYAVCIVTSVFRYS